MTSNSPSRQRRQFTAEFKESAVRLAQQPGARISQVACDLDISDSLLRNWIRAAEVARGNDHEDLRLEVARLRREVRILRENEAILKKAAAFFAREQR